MYYFNTKEIVGNKYGTTNPVPFRVVDRNVGLDIDIAIRCHGEYSYKITNPLLFYSNVCGNVETSYPRTEIDSQLKTELMTALQPAFAKISEMGIVIPRSPDIRRNLPMRSMTSFRKSGGTFGLGNRFFRRVFGQKRPKKTKI